MRTLHVYRHKERGGFFCTATPQEACVTHPEDINPVKMIDSAWSYLVDNYPFEIDTELILANALDELNADDGAR